MEFCIVNADGVIENIIVADGAFAAEIGAHPYYEGARIGAEYAPTEVEPEPNQLDIIEAQVTYTAMMTGTLLEV